MKVLKIVGIVIGVLAVLVGGFFGWFYVTKVVAPEPEEMCAHVQSLMERDLASDLQAETGGGKPSKLTEELARKQIDEHSRECVASAKRRKEFDAVAYAREAKCAVAAGTLKDAFACSRKPAKR